MQDYNKAMIDDLRAHEGHASSGRFLGKPVLILTTIGARTGKRREAPLAYSRDGADLVIVASKGGAPDHPAWYRNLVVDPSVTVEVDGKAIRATASVADEVQRRRLYDRHAEIHTMFKDYEQKTDRVIPVIVLRPEASSAAA